MNPTVRELEMKVLVGNRKIAGPANLVSVNGSYTRVYDGQDVVPCGEYFIGFEGIREMAFKKYQNKFEDSRVIIASRDTNRNEFQWEYFDGKGTWTSQVGPHLKRLTALGKRVYHQ